MVLFSSQLRNIGLLISVSWLPYQVLPELEKDQFYEQLETVTRHAETVIIGGDLNGHV